MPSRLLRSATAVALATSATTFAYVGSAAPAQAAGSNGYCKTSSGVTVVVDFRNLGGGIAIRCSPVGSGATGIDALQAAGIPVEGTRTTGLAVPCRIYGKPSATATLPGGYHEQCVRMPPTKAYWSYWHASNGGSWGYSQLGAGNRTVTPGGFEGWSFSEGSNVAPGAAPSRPAAPPKPAPTHKTTTQPAPPRHTTTTAPKHGGTTSKHGDPAPSKHGGSSSTGSQPKSTTSSTAAEKKSKSAKSKASAEATASKKAKAAKSSSSSTSSNSSRASASSAGAAAGTSSGGPTNVAGAPMANSNELIKDANKSSGINATTVVGGLVLAALAVGGGAVAIIRRRNVGQ